MVLGSMNAHDVTPYPSEIAPSLRNLGYSLKTAVADLVDNSVSAGATEVQVSFFWNGELSYIRVSDDGGGMVESALQEAVRFGRDPSKERQPGDLGRFGLGLKFASWSQCRCITVRSKTIGRPPATRRIDLDHILSTDQWEVLEDAKPGSDERLDTIARYTSGTVVLWECLDTLNNSGTLASSDLFWQAVSEVDGHLSMTFHRFLERRTLKIKINGSEVRPWDPLMAGHPQRSSTRVEYIRGPNNRMVIFEGHALPSKRFLTDEEFKSAGGPKGWIPAQGFYLYRGDRLVLGGGWLGLSKGTQEWKQDAAFKNVRISLDISNAADLDWGLDLMKSTARPPAAFRPRLVQLADHVRRMGRSISAAESKSSKILVGGDGLWKRKDVGTASRFTINRRHPLVRQALAETTEASRASLKLLLDLLDNTAPMQPATAATPQPTPLSPEEQSLIQLAKTIFYTLKRSGGVSNAEALMRLLELPQFASRPDLAEAGAAEARATET